MVKKFTTFDPQLEVVEHSAGSAVRLSNSAKLSLYKKSQKSGIATDILEEVYRRGYTMWNAKFGDSPEQFAFDRINSFLAGGFAAEHLDGDLMEDKPVWDKPNPVSKHKHLSPAKKAAAKARAKSAGRPYPNMVDNMWAARNEDYISETPGNGNQIAKTPGHMVSMEQPWHPEDPNAAHRKNFHRKREKELKKLEKEKIKQESYTGAEKTSNDFTKPNSRFIGTPELTKILKDQTPGQSTKETIKRVVSELYEPCENCTCGMNENWQNSKYKNPEGGLTQAGVNAYRREHPGSKLKTAVTTEPSKLKAGSKSANRRKSFCARMGGMKKRLTSAKTAHDPDSRINKALRKWHCEDTEINELSVPLGTTGKRAKVSTPLVAIRMASGKIEMHPAGKSGSSGGGGSDE